jgi:hypothetical protein
MPKFYGNIGFIKTEETSPGVWTEQIIEKKYYFDVMKNNIKWSSSEQLNDDLTISNQFSILADSFLYENIGYIRYIEFLNSKWKISNIDIQYPRLILSTGGLYNA